MGNILKRLTTLKHRLESRKGKIEAVAMCQGGKQIFLGKKKVRDKSARNRNLSTLGTFSWELADKFRRTRNSRASFLKL
jgi:hypothetical protein